MFLCLLRAWYCLNQLAWIYEMSFARWRHFITLRGSDCGYPRAVLSLEQGLTILFWRSISDAMRWRPLRIKRVTRLSSFRCRNTLATARFVMWGRPGSRLGKSTWGRLERSKSTQVTFVYRQVGFVWHRLFRVKSTSRRKYVSCTWCSPTLLLILLIFTLIV